MAAFEIHHPQRLPPPEIFGAAPGRMLLEAPFNIGGNPGIEGVVRTKKDVDVPLTILGGMIHLQRLANQFPSGSYSLIR